MNRISMADAGVGSYRPSNHYARESDYYEEQPVHRQYREDDLSDEEKERAAVKIWELDISNSNSSTPRDSTEYIRDEKAEHDLEKGDHGSGPRPPVTLRTRIQHFTWAWFTLTMSTGGIATLIAVEPHRFPGLTIIGTVIYVFNLVLFTALCVTMGLRFCMFPGSLKESLKHEREGLFFPTLWLSIATIITGTQKYVIQPLEQGDDMGKWLRITLAVVFWFYLICTSLVAIVQYSYVFAGPSFNLQKIMPSVFLPIFPIMLAGTIASVIASDLPLGTRMPILVAGLACQGLGFSVSLFMYPLLIGRLLQSGFPNREHRPALFIGVGPPSFTALAIIGMANSLPEELEINGDAFLDIPVFKTMAFASGILLWGLAMWFFMIAAIATLISVPEDFHLGWWAMVFPNTGFTIATIQIGNSIRSEGVLYFGNAMTIVVVGMWAFVFCAMVKATWTRSIMYPGRDEDVAD
ncbi:hypothetical protein K402DRAFT_399376 [Aulographum hederae CBS 113979]|uniref:C4-dicarboxylate transporter/malic acid transport protein n=1 Tax=Aulographum hederae CBS 113979 TaxID=1176131 RepID=A0A6G1HG72_9PEZI|nr:hypothetical protein K402DRAFT_399376 [Aulographum hederae CBS 113979]